LRREAVATACWNLAPATSTRSSWTKATGKVKAASEAAESSLMRYNVGFAAIAVNVSQGSRAGLPSCRRGAAAATQLVAPSYHPAAGVRSNCEFGRDRRREGSEQVGWRPRPKQYATFRRGKLHCAKACLSCVSFVHHLKAKHRGFRTYDAIRIVAPRSKRVSLPTGLGRGLRKNRWNSSARGVNQHVLSTNSR
jgi:hypothetical protein